MAVLYNNYCIVPSCWLEHGTYGDGPLGTAWPAGRRLSCAYDRAFDTGANAHMCCTTIFYRPERIPALVV
jgi:hypothetical protein